MSGVLALALKRLALSRGTVPSAVPVGHVIEAGTNGTPGTPGTVGTRGTASAAFLDGDPIDVAEVDERAALAADSVPACYIDAWARLQVQRPLSVSQDRWRTAINDAGLFLDAWGKQAEGLGWTAGDLFDVPRDGKPGGLEWFSRWRGGGGIRARSRRDNGRPRF